MFGIERVMDHVAHVLGQDPCEVRRINYYAAAPTAGGPSGGSFPAKMKPGEKIETGDLARRGAVNVASGSGGAHWFSGAHWPTAPTRDNTSPYDMALTDFILQDMTDTLLYPAPFDSLP